jgi:zinc protease
MCNNPFKSEEVDLERTVIISEREGNENEPHFLLGEAIQCTAFNRHPYKYEVIGLKEDLQTMTREDLYRHYQQYYHPGNAVLAVAGDFDTKSIKEKISEHFSPLARKNDSPIQIPEDPPLDEEKRLSVTGPGETSYVQISYRAPSASNPDFFALTVLDSLLTGPTSLNMFGSGGTSNKTSRLYRALVEGEISVSCHGSLQATKDPYLYSIHLTVHPEHSPEQVLEAVDQQIKQILDSPVNQAEIDRAIKQARALFAYSSEDISNQGFWLGYAEMFASYDWFENYVEHLAEVTPEKALEIARAYLVPKNRVVGFYIPEESQA